MCECVWGHKAEQRRQNWWSEKKRKEEVKEFTDANATFALSQKEERENEWEGEKLIIIIII